MHQDDGRIQHVGQNLVPQGIGGTPADQPGFMDGHPQRAEAIDPQHKFADTASMAAVQATGANHPLRMPVMVPEASGKSGTRSPMWNGNQIMPPQPGSTLDASWVNSA